MIENKKYIMIPKNFISFLIIWIYIILTLSGAYFFIRQPEIFRKGIDTEVENIETRIQNIEEIQDMVETHRNMLGHLNHP